MNFSKNIIFGFIILFCSYSAFAGVIDSLKTNEEYKTILHDDEFINLLFYKHYNNMLLNNLGNYGSPYYFATTYQQDNQYNIFSPLELKTKLFKLSGFKPFTNLTWINAGRREQILSINHLQKFGNVADFQLLYKRIGSPGDYINQEVNDNDLNAEFNVKTPNEVYQALFTFRYHTLYNQENGGLKNIDDFKKDSIERRELYNVNLKNSYYTSRTLGFGVSQKIVLFKTLVDSIITNQVYFRVKNDVISYRKEFFDNDASSVLYDTTILDKTFAPWKDSIHINFVNNRVAFGLIKNKIKIEPFYQYKSEKQFQYMGIDTLYSSQYFGAQLAYNLDKLAVDLEFNFGVQGYNEKDFNLKGILNYQLQNNKYFTLNVNHYLNEPELFIKSFTSNHFKWDNYSFTKQQETFIGSEFIFSDIQLKLMANGKMIKNLIYFDTLALPSQNNKVETISTFMVEKSFKIKNVHFLSAILYQMTSDRYILPMPTYVARQMIYYENKIFKSNLKIRVGANVSYTSKYYAHAFMPSISQFYTQNKSRTGEYPFIDFFISTHLKRAHIFVKWEHINSGFSGFNYFSTPNTPFLDRSFKFGVSWNLFD